MNTTASTSAQTSTPATWAETWSQNRTSAANTSGTTRTPTSESWDKIWDDAESKLRKEAKANDLGFGLDVDPALIRGAAYEDLPKSVRTSQYKGHTIFIGNLFFDTTADDLKSQMSKYGVVEAARIIYDTRGISKGFGYVQFDSIKAAGRAVDALHGRVFQGRIVSVQYSRAALQHARNLKPTDTLYVSNIPFNVTDRELQKLAASLQNVIDVRVNMDRETGQFRGFAHFQFLNVSSAVVAYEQLCAKPFKERWWLKVEYSNTHKSITNALGAE
ncbi:hypothetical protein BJY04DRAFT_23394 [Aspergillus karnatakaensis]|uniref:nucleic acid-binding protein n=1 Tax=Aspergillus karnatakaensis TaxID=1810916 RepID=UPI003CCDB738